MPRGGRRENAGRKPASRNRLNVEIKATLAETAKAYTADAVETLVSICRDPKASPAARVTAAAGLLDRGWGRPVQQLEHTGKEDGPIVVTWQPPS